jgi:predicted nucleotidyltransferase component of viral defense system
MIDFGSDRLYPTRLADLNEWAKLHKTTSDEARRRFVQFVVLECFAASDIAKSLAFKGGNALRFGYGYPRSTVDLDFTARDLEDDAANVRHIIDSAVRSESESFGIKCKVSSIRRNPQNLARSRPTYVVNVAYSFPSDRRTFADFFSNETPRVPVVPVEITFNDVVCETVFVHFGSDDTAGIEICTLNDILAEKLRAILQQVVRNRNRPQDVYDVARIGRIDRANIDLGKVKNYIAQKCEAREIVFTEEAFDVEVRSRAKYGYDELRADLGDHFIAFDDAWLEVVSIVRELLAVEPSNGPQR